MEYAWFLPFNSKKSSHVRTPIPTHERWGNYAAIQRPERPRRRGICLLIISVVVVSVVFTALLWVPDITSWRHAVLSHPRILGNEATALKRCGQTPSQGTASEAKALGCVYDMISGSWVFPECHDRDLEEEFLSHEPRWQWWADEGRTEELSVDEILATGGGNPTGYFVTPEYHDYHCAFTWRKLHRAMEGNRLIDEHVGGMRHTDHCSRTMYRDRTDEPEVAHFDLIFSGCIKL